MQLQFKACGLKQAIQYGKVYESDMTKYWSGWWLSGDLRTNTRRGVFKRRWTTFSKSIHYSGFSVQHNSET